MMKLRSKNKRRAKCVEPPIFSPSEESLVDKALYASLHTSKKRRLDDSARDGDNSDLFGSNGSQKLLFAARKTASIVAPGTSKDTLNTSFDSDTKSTPPSQVSESEYPSTEKFLTFMALRDTPHLLPDNLRYFEEIQFERVSKVRKSPISNQKAKKKANVAASKIKKDVPHQRCAQKSLAKAKKSLTKKVAKQQPKKVEKTKKVKLPAPKTKSISSSSNKKMAKKVTARPVGRPPKATSSRAQTKQRR